MYISLVSTPFPFMLTAKGDARRLPDLGHLFPAAGSDTRCVPNVSRAILMSSMYAKQKSLKSPSILVMSVCIIVFFFLYLFFLKIAINGAILSNTVRSPFRSCLDLTAVNSL
ncbi:hypothetical protein ABW21_db0203445 [Orbilia brochopaga]|nr:hypothetical protein ABW21_db0203445 [Drechslerella brochopaga]